MLSMYLAITVKKTIKAAYKLLYDEGGGGRCAMISKPVPRGGRVIVIDFIKQSIPVYTIAELVGCCERIEVQLCWQYIYLRSIRNSPSTTKINKDSELNLSALICLRKRICEEIMMRTIIYVPKTEP